MRITLMSAVALVGVAAAPPTAWAVDYMSPQQAQQSLFPQADHFAVREIALDAAQMQALSQSLGMSARSARWKVIEASQSGKVLGWVVVDNVVGKFELITYAVGVGVDGAIRQVEILSYRESHGAEIRLPAWRAQFVGKTAQSGLMPGKDIANISGATLSCTHVSDGVRRVLAVLALARSGQLLGA